MPLHEKLAICREACDHALLATINGDKMRYARDMLLGHRSARDDIPCTTCENYLSISRRGSWLQRDVPSSIDRLKARLRRLRWLITLRRRLGQMTSSVGHILTN